MFISFCRFIAKQLKCNNRVMVAFTLIVILIGYTLICDWQAIRREDPCDLPLFDNGTIDASEAPTSPSSFENITRFDWNVDNCELRNVSGDDCFWNPLSRVTGDHCHTCHHGCLSKQLSLNFYQYAIGVLLVAIGATLHFVFNLALSSDIFPPENQVKTLSFSYTIMST